MLPSSTVKTNELEKQLPRSTTRTLRCFLWPTAIFQTSSLQTIPCSQLHHYLAAPETVAALTSGPPTRSMNRLPSRDESLPKIPHHGEPFQTREPSNVAVRLHTRAIATLDYWILVCTHPCSPKPFSVDVTRNQQTKGSHTQVCATYTAIVSALIILVV